jgi:HD domain
MPVFRDMLYGRIETPDFLAPFICLPEFVRLRGVGLSNVDSYEFKDFGGPTRWEHGIGVAHLAVTCAAARGLGQQETVQLTLAALLHDVATPPFAHTAEYVLPGFDHELATRQLLAEEVSDDTTPDLPVFASQLPQFRNECRRLSRRLGLRIDPDAIAEMVVGDGSLGFLIVGTLDLDNADNVTRACAHLGLPVERDLPVRLARWLAGQDVAPTAIPRVTDPAVVLWSEYRRWLYGVFFESSTEEVGRQAFLQHLMRRAVSAGLPRRVLLWNTEPQLLDAIARAPEGGGMYPLSELVQRYRLLEAPTLLFAEQIDDEETFRALSLPQAATWIEEALSTSALEAVVFLAARRWSAGETSSLLPPAPGALFVFKVGGPPKVQHFPDWLRSELPPRASGAVLSRSLRRAISRRLPIWTEARPWLAPTRRAREGAVQLLDGLGDWSFRLSKNESYHVYPGTFVHAIPSALINVLGLRGEFVGDLFGGTGQTAIEAVKLGGRALTNDSNAVASLVARARLTYLTADQRMHLRSVAVRASSAAPGAFPAASEDPPDFPLRDKWFHPATLDDLTRLASFIRGEEDAAVSQFLTASFSAILTEATGRWGKQHGFFADNTPLARDQPAPPYRDANALFADRINRSIALTQRFYAVIERAGRSPERELARASVHQADATTARAGDYGLAEHSLAAIITSPPYLCMADYALGARLSYYWLWPERLAADFDLEIAPRRSRGRPAKALDSYRRSFAEFAGRSHELIRPGGYLALVLGTPTARSFAGEDLVRDAHLLLEAAGFRELWTRERRIQWHRHHGFERLKTESIMVYVAEE